MKRKNTFKLIGASVFLLASLYLLYNSQFFVMGRLNWAIKGGDPEEIAGFLSNKDRYARIGAINALSKIGGEFATEQIIAAANNQGNDIAVRFCCVNGLISINTNESFEGLIQIMERSDGIDGVVRCKAVISVLDLINKTVEHNVDLNNDSYAPLGEEIKKWHAFNDSELNNGGFGRIGIDKLVAEIKKWWSVNKQANILEGEHVKSK